MALSIVVLMNDVRGDAVLGLPAIRVVVHIGRCT